MIFTAIAVTLIFITGLIGGLIPTRIPETESGKRLLTLGNALAGGIFFGAALFHLWPDSLEFIADSSLATPITFPFLLAAAGFLLVLFLEKVLLTSEDVGAMSANRNAFYPYVLTLVLSIHSIIAGTALGLEGDTPDGVALLIAILAHKAFAGIALGISLSRAGFSYRNHISIVVLFALSTPMGVVIGNFLSSILENDMTLIVEGIFDAVAAGTFLYVALMDIISETFEEAGDRWVKFIMVILGLILMLLLTFME